MEKLKKQIVFKKIYENEHMLEFKVTVCDGYSLFSIDVYVSLDYIEELIEALNLLKLQNFSGIYDIKMGKIGYEYAGGIFHARLHYEQRDVLYISTFQQSDFSEFKKTEVASEAKMYLISNPVFIDDFIKQLHELKSYNVDEVILNCSLEYKIP